MKVEWSEQAINDLQGIRNYITRDSEFYAARFAARIVEAAERLATFPHLGRRVPEALEAEQDLREILFHAYRIIYRLRSDQLLLVTIVHGSRDLAGVEPKPWDIA